MRAHKVSMAASKQVSTSSVNRVLADLVQIRIFLESDFFFFFRAIHTVYRKP